MLGRTFRTMKDNPKILLFFAAMYAVPIVIVIVAAMAFMPGLMDIENTFMSNDPAFASNFLMIYSAIMGASFFIGLAMVTVVIPPVFNYIYEVCAGMDTQGWYKRGLKRSWWKLIVLFIIYTAVLTPVMLVMMFVIMLLDQYFWIGMILVYVLMFAIIIYMSIAMAAIIAEEDLGKALGNTFTLGSRYFFKMLGTMILVMIPSFIISAILSFTQIQGFMTDSFNWVGYIISMLITFIYSMFAYAFLYTYSMNSYLNEKGAFYTPPTYNEDDSDLAKRMAITTHADTMER